MKFFLQNQKIEQLESKQKETNEKLCAQERYTSNDCVVVCNPPFDPSDGRYVLSNKLKLFYDYLGFDLNEDRTKAFHFMPGTGGLGLFASMIVQFIYFKEKNWVYSCRHKLNQGKNQVNGKNIFLNERILIFEAQIKAEASKKGFFTSTKNCSVSVLVKKSDNSTSNVTVNDIQELELLPRKLSKNLSVVAKGSLQKTMISNLIAPRLAVTSRQKRKKGTSFEVNLAVKTLNELNYFCYFNVILL